MKVVQYKSGDGVEKVGVLKGERVIPLGADQPTKLIPLLEGAEDPHTVLAKCASSDEAGIALDSVTLLAPVTRPDKVICIGMNYIDHCAEQNCPVPAEPVIFSKWGSTIIPPYADIPLPEHTKKLDWEVELAFIIKKEGKNIPVESAMDYVFGYTVAHDVSARDWQLEAGRNGGQWQLGKSQDNFCPLGPCIVTADDLDPHDLAISCKVNDVVKQDSSTRQLVHNIPALVAYMSRFFTLLPGDVVLTGTPPGVGVFKKPPEYLKVGDVVECHIENIGFTKNKII